MTDYHPLISKAVAGLDPGAPRESRQALYERARAAQLTQLRTGNPPFSEIEITCERLALEEAVRRVEAEAAQRARDCSLTAGDDMGRAAAVGAKRRSPFSPIEEDIEAPPMIVTGGATGRLVGFWRWRSLPPWRIDGR